MKITSDILELLRQYNKAKEAWIMKHPNDAYNYYSDKVKDIADKIKDKLGIDPDNIDIDTISAGDCIPDSDVIEAGGSVVSDIIDAIGGLFS